MRTDEKCWYIQKLQRNGTLWDTIGSPLNSDEVCDYLKLMYYNQDALGGPQTEFRIVDHEGKPNTPSFISRQREPAQAAVTRHPVGLSANADEELPF